MIVALILNKMIVSYVCIVGICVTAKAAIAEMTNSRILSVQTNKQKYINLVHTSNTMAKELKDFTDEDIFADDILVKDFKKLSRSSLTGEDSEDKVEQEKSIFDLPNDQVEQEESIFDLPKEAETEGKKEKSIFDIGGDSF